MKKNILMAIIALAIFTTAFAGETNNVDFRVLNSFKNEFSNYQDLSWKTTNTYVKASFIMNNEKIEAFYNYDGTLMGTSKSIAFDKLPESAVRKITTKYPFPPYSLQKCIETTDAQGEVNYYISLLNENQQTIIVKIDTHGGVSQMQ
jgi:hypothetical protein